MITQHRLKEILDYDPASGVFTWLYRPFDTFKAVGAAKRWNARYAYSPAGTLKSDGYIHISVGGKKWLAHRLAFLYMIGRFPPVHVDHINGVKNDNRWINLREVDRIENCRNMKMYSTNASGVAGVHFHELSKRWCSQISGNSKRINLGYFDDFFEAVCARRSAENLYNYHSNHGRKP